MVLCSMAVLNSCVKDNEEIVDYDVVLTFNPAIYSNVKGSFNGNYPDNISFGVTAHSHPFSESWEESSTSSQEYLGNEKVSKEGERWHPESKCNWPHITKQLSVIGYSPYGEAENCCLEKGIIFNDVNTVEQQTDLLYTDPVTDVHKTIHGGVISLPFKHALCSVGIKVKNLVEESDKIIVTDIKLTNIKYKGDFVSLPNAHWNLEEDVTDLVFYKGEYISGQSPKSLGETFLVIPQELNGVFTVKYRYYTSAGTFIENTLQTRAVSTNLQLGRNYTYTISVGIDEVKFLLEVIDDYLN